MIKFLFVQKDNHTHCKSNHEVDTVTRERRCMAVYGGVWTPQGGVVTNILTRLSRDRRKLP